MKNMALEADRPPQAAASSSLNEPRISAFRPFAVIAGARSLMVGGVLRDSSAVLQALLWCAGLMVVLAPIAVRKYRKVA